MSTALAEPADLPAEATKATRKDEILAAYLADGSQSMAAVGKEFGVSREWVRQVVAASGIDPAEIEQLRHGDAKRRQREERAALVSSVRSALAADTGIATLDGLAAATGYGRRDIQSCRGHLKDEFRTLRVRFRQQGPRPSAPSQARYSDEDILAALRRVASSCPADVLTAPLYQQAHGTGDPSLSLISARFGGFVAACGLAGVRSSGHRPKTARYAEQDYFDAIRRCAEAVRGGDVPDLGARDYGVWAKANGAPSLSRVRQIFGNWNRAKICFQRALP